MGELEVAVQVAAVGRSSDNDVFVGRRGELSRLGPSSQTLPV